ncbi:elongation factor P maturation arginine rhamnosyltransferase EarP [Castellaniella sp.]|uniref:elongation factor P maturation arginine rhamnosyltransferase EarP n=1 Tax=Castellaniella sp. TaxID=1955812 RepID=UPI003A8EFA0D
MPVDIFCQIIDNFGDAGVCWRLAQQYAALGHRVRLWIDDLATLARLAPALDATMLHQHVHGIEVGHWSLAAQAQAPVDGLVIEAFACTLPSPYQASLAQTQSLWINLEYLSAEPWIDGYHGLPSLQPNRVAKYFYFPGFTAASGGLLREPDLLDRRRQALGMDRRLRLSQITGWPVDTLPADARYILLFCYPGAPIDTLLAALAQMDTPTCLLLAGTHVGGAATAAQGEGNQHTDASSTGNLQVRTLPFVPQAQFDDLLWCCDLNFVRGEDSLVRALWAGAPLVWHIYPQAEDTHLTKLEAWLQRAQLPTAANALIRAWNAGPLGRTSLSSHAHPSSQMAECLADALAPISWKAWQIRAQQWSDELATQPDLASQLLRFYQQHAQTR